MFAILFIQSVLSCTKLRSDYTIYGSVGEIQEWNIRDYFFSGGDMTFKVSPSSSKYFDSAKQPLTEIGASQQHEGVASNVISIKPYVSQLTGDWLNSFVFIEEDSSSVDIFFSLGLQSENDKVPNFSIYINVVSDPNFKCYDVDFLTQTTFVVDCSQDQSNYFLVVNTAAEKSTIANNQLFNAPKIRKILLHIFYYVDTSIKMLIRGQYQESKGSLIEVFLIKNDIIESQAALTLDSKTLATLLSQPEDFVFTFVDMQVEPNGDIFILDAHNGIYIFKILKSIKWALKEWSRLNYGQQVYAFDFNYMLNYTKQLVLVFEDKIQYFQDNVPKSVLPLPGAIIPDMQIEISQKYIVLRYSTGIYVYNKQELIYSMLDAVVDKIIINPYEPDLVGVNDFASYRFLINDGILRILKQDSPSESLFQGMLQAIPKSGQTCNVTLLIQILYPNNTQIFETSDKPFPKSLTVPADPFNIDLMAIGPDISYQPYLQQSSGIEISIKEMWKLDAQFQNSNVEYTDIFVVDDYFILLQQLSSKEMFYYVCQHNQLQQTEAKCFLNQKFQLNVIATKTTFAWWFEQDKIFYIIQEEEKLVCLYVTDKTIPSQKVDEIRTTEKILSFALLRGMLFVVLPEKVNVYAYSIPFELSHIINKIGSPVKVFGNRNIDIIFIQTTTGIILGSMVVLTSGSEFTMIKQIPITQGAEIKVTLGKDYFFVIQKTETLSQIDEYDYSHPQIIFKTKKLPLYNYVIQDSIVADACEESGWLFLRCKDEKETVILIYEPGVLSHQSLKKIIKLGKIVPITVEADGGAQMFLHYQQQIYSILQDSLLYVKSNIQSDQYVNNILSGVKASNEAYSLNITQPLIVLDTHSVPIFNNSNNQTIHMVNGSDIMIIKMNTSLYTGQITYMDINCSQCSQAELIQPITNVTNGQDMSYDLIDGLKYNEEYLVYLQNKQLVFQYRNGTFAKVFDMKSNITVLETGDGLFMSEDQKYIIVSVLGTAQSILLIECGTNIECKITQKLAIPEAKRIRTVKLMNPNHLIVMNSNPNDFSQVQSSIIVYFLNKDYTLTIAKTINSQTLELDSLNIASLDVVRHNQYYTLLYIDSSIGLRISHFNNVDLKYEQTTELFSLKVYQNEQFFIHEDTKLYQVVAIQTKTQDKQVIITTLIQTNNVAQYIFNLPFDIAVLPYLITTKIELKYILTPFGTWESVNKLQYIENHVIVPYRQGTEAILVVYELKEKSGIATISSNFALQENYNGILSSQFVLVLDIQNGFTYFYTNLKYDAKTMRHVLQKYQFNSNPVIILENVKDIKPQPITITVSNHYGSSSGIVYLVYDDGPIDDNTQSSLTWLWILLGVLGGLIIVGGLGYQVYQRKNKNKTGLLLLQ